MLDKCNSLLQFLEALSEAIAGTKDTLVHSEILLHHSLMHVTRSKQLEKKKNNDNMLTQALNAVTLIKKILPDD